MRMPVRCYAWLRATASTKPTGVNIARRHFTQEQSHSTIKNLLINKETRVIYQGFTGRVATSNAKESIEYGTNIVGGVTPGKEGEHLGLPLLPTLRAAKEQLRPDATAIFVPATGAAAAIEEAIEAEIPLIVAVAEHIPLHDMLRVTQMLATSKSRLVGANSPGIISPLHSCRIGFQPLPMYMPGNIGVVAKSGTLSYETVASLTRAGLGQSLCIGTGGDIVSGTTLLEGFLALKDDPDTHGIVIVGEVGGKAEQATAYEIVQARKQGFNKPVLALVAGRTLPGDKIMGHAGAFPGLGEKSGRVKYNSMREIGVDMIDHPEQFGPAMKDLLAGKASDKPLSASPRKQPSSQFPRSRQDKAGAFINPGYRRPSMFNPADSASSVPVGRVDKRHLWLDSRTAAPLLLAQLPDGVESREDSPSTSGNVDPGWGLMRLGIDRNRMVLRLFVKLAVSNNSRFDYAKLVLQSRSNDEADALKELDGLSLTRRRPELLPVMREMFRAMYAVHTATEAVEMMVFFQSTARTSKDGGHEGDGVQVIAAPRIRLDDSAFRTAKRQAELFATRRTEDENALEVEAEQHGIVYVYLHAGDEEASIGTLVNGAGLAMNTVDVLSLPPYNGKCVNFLDTGGKATSDTVKRSFELILRDPRTKVIFVNIFGGLTDCGMIADGIILAFKEVEMRGVPVVVRLRGTNEAEGQRKIAESGLQLEAFDGFADAAKRVIELSKGDVVAQEAEQEE